MWQLCCQKTILFNHWKMKSPHHSLPKLQQKSFSLCSYYPILGPKFWTSWDYSFIHTSFHSVFLQLWQMSPHSTCPCFRLHRERVQNEGCCKNNCKPTASQLLSKEIQHTNLDFAYFCGVEGNFSFPSMLPKHSYSLPRQKRALAGETVLAEGPLHSRSPPLIPASAAKFSHWNPPACFLPALN